MMNKKMITSLVLGVLISGGGLYLAFRNIPYQELFNTLAGMNYIWIIPSVGLVIVSFGLRALRWQIILSSTVKVPFWHAYHPLMIGFMMNSILPARMGEMARPAILYKKNNVPFATGLATVAAERVFDLSILIILFVLVTFFVHIDPNLSIQFENISLTKDKLESIGANMTKVGVLLIVGIVMINVNWFRAFIIKFIEGTPNRLVFLKKHQIEHLKRSVGDKIIGIINNFSDGLSAVKQPGKLLACIGVSILVWYLQALSYFVMALCFPGIDLSFGEMTAVMVIICFFIALPSAPGFWGVWEAGGKFALLLFAVSKYDAAGYALGSHVIQMVPVIIMGFISAAVFSVNIRKIQYGTD